MTGTKQKKTGCTGPLNAIIKEREENHMATRYKRRNETIAARVQPTKPASALVAALTDRLSVQDHGQYSPNGRDKWNS